MMRTLRKYRYQIFLFTLGIFLVGTFVGFGGYFFSGAAAGDSIAEVNGEKIPLRLYFAHYGRAMAQLPSGASADKQAQQQRRDEVLRDLIQMEVFHQLAERYRLQVPDEQVANSLAQVPAFQENGAFSPRAYLRALQTQLRTNPRDFEEEQRRSIEFFKLRWLVQSAIKVTERETEMLWALRGPEFQTANEFVKEGEKKRRRTPEEIRAAFREQMWQDKVMWAFNQWFQQIGQQTKVKTHLDRLEQSRT